MAALFAATYPERCRGLVLYGGFARAPPGLRPRDWRRIFGYVEQAWGSGHSLPMFAPSRKKRSGLAAMVGPIRATWREPGGSDRSSCGCSSQIDISDILSSIHVPTLVIHCTGDTLINVECGRFLAEHIPGARLLELPGDDHLFFLHEQIGDAIEEFLTGSISAAESDRVLATVLFTDIVGSTARAEAIGRPTLAQSARRASHDGAAATRALPRQRSEIAGGRVSRHLRRSGTCRALRLRHCRGGWSARHSSPQRSPYWRNRAGRQRCEGHRRPHRLARLGTRRARRGAGITDRQGSGRRVRPQLQQARKTFTQGPAGADGPLRGFELTARSEWRCAA